MAGDTKILPKGKFPENKEEVNNYIVEMVYELQNMYNELSDSVDGSLKSSFYQQKELWTPVLNGTTTSGTFTYTNQIGWVFRQGLMVDIWGDLSWTAVGAATGNLYVELPYKVANSSEIPFVGFVQSSNIPYAAGNSYISINAIPDSYRGEIWQSGSAIPTANLTVPASGRIIFHIRYLGVQDER